ncbi:MAG: hypothetical protein H0U40_08230 [Chloroflexia bacterium]|nr:hypothetical protein [Chloroflexia bacterium]
MGTVSLNLDRHEVAALCRALSDQMARCGCGTTGDESLCPDCQVIAPILGDAERLDRRPRLPARMVLPPMETDRPSTSSPARVVEMFPAGPARQRGPGRRAHGRM